MYGSETLPNWSIACHTKYFGKNFSFWCNFLFVSHIFTTGTMEILAFQEHRWDPPEHKFHRQ